MQPILIERIERGRDRSSEKQDPQSIARGGERDGVAANGSGRGA